MKRFAIVLATVFLGRCVSFTEFVPKDLEPREVLNARKIYVLASTYFNAGTRSISDQALADRVRLAIAREFPGIEFVDNPSSADLTVTFFLQDEISCIDCESNPRYWSWSGQVMKIAPSTSESSGTASQTISFALRGETHKILRHPENDFARQLRAVARRQAPAV
jgi:hypothetical protein